MKHKHGRERDEPHHVIKHKRLSAEFYGQQAEHHERARKAMEMARTSMLRNGHYPAACVILDRALEYLDGERAVHFPPGVLLVDRVEHERLLQVETESRRATP